MAILICLGLFFIIKLINSFGVRDSNDKIIKETIKEFIKKENIVVDVIKKETNRVNQKFDFSISDSERLALDKIDFKTNEFLNCVEDVVDVVSSLVSARDFINLKKILSDKLYNRFKEQIESLASKNSVLKAQIIEIIDKKIDSLKIKGDCLYIYVYINSIQINYAENDKKEVVMGNKKEKCNIKEKWIFKRNLEQKDSFWFVEDVIFREKCHLT
ncbi:MAG: TIM44-like domain-containing protein [Rickettsiales bacterium]|nr:TIM44-like domain-containing protein [Rickettsiales bacterium]